MIQRDASVVGNADISAWDFRVYKDGLQCYAVAGSNIYRYQFNFDVSNTVVTTLAFFKPFSKFDGKTYTVNATPKEIVISCSDCTSPGVYFFDENLELFTGGNFEISNLSKTPLHVATSFSDKYRRTQVLVGSNARADLIERVSDSLGNERFRMSGNYFTGNAATDGSDSTVTVGIDKHVLVIKQTNSDVLQMAASCQLGYFYDNSTNTCNECPIAQKSFGGQNTQCFSCLQMRWEARNDEFAEALY